MSTLTRPPRDLTGGYYSEATGSAVYRWPARRLHCRICVLLDVLRPADGWDHCHRDGHRRYIRGPLCHRHNVLTGAVDRGVPVRTAVSDREDQAVREWQWNCPRCWRQAARRMSSTRGGVPCAS